MDGMKPLVDLNHFVWDRFKADLADVTAEEADWRPLPEANSINVLVRHLRIEGEWHAASLERGEPMPSESTPALQQAVDAVPLDLERNMNALEAAYTRFLAALHGATLDSLEQRTKLAYGDTAKAPQHFLGFHQAVHLSMHWAQIRTLRTLYKKTRGEPVPARYYPGNVSYPRSAT